jgi:hypothetical protein
MATLIGYANVTAVKDKLDAVDNKADIAHTHTISDITDFAETVTDISFDAGTKVLSYTDENGTPTNIDLSAAFTGSAYDDTNVLKDADTVSPVTEINKLMTQEDVASLGGGDMLKSVYDTNNNGKVDSAENADTVNGFTVKTAVPANAVFGGASYTDAEIKTKYEANLDTNAFTDDEKTKLAGVATNANNYSLPKAAPTVLGGLKARLDGTHLYLTSDGGDA